MASVVEMCNIALAQIRAGSINSLTEASVQAQQCNLHYEIARDQVLSDADWGFNRKLVPLAELSTVTVFNWSHVWQHPSDCLFVNELVRNVKENSPTDSSTVPSRVYDSGIRTLSQLAKVQYQLFTVEGNRVIASIEDDLRINYRCRITDPNLMSANFRMAVSALLGAYLAMPIAGAKEGRPLRADSLEMYKAFKTEAKDDNANQEYFEPTESDYITVRN